MSHAHTTNQPQLLTHLKVDAHTGPILPFDLNFAFKQVELSVHSIFVYRQGAPVSTIFGVALSKFTVATCGAVWGLQGPVFCTNMQHNSPQTCHTILPHHYY